MAISPEATRKILLGNDSLGAFEEAISGAAKAAPGTVKSPPGVLSRIGRFIDTPGRAVRTALTGRKDATGHDVLEKLFGIRNKEGKFDVTDILAFAAEVGLDPLNLLVGVGSLTKAGKLAKAFGTVAHQRKAVQNALRDAKAIGDVARVARETDTLAQITKRGEDLGRQLDKMGASRELAKGASAQAKESVAQRQAIRFGIPFTDIGIGARGAPVLGALGKAGKALAETGPGKGLRALFNPDTFRLADGTLVNRSEGLAAHLAHGRGERIGSLQRQPETVEQLTELLGKADVGPEDFQDLKGAREVKTSPELAETARRLQGQVSQQPLAVGTFVRSADRGNWGTILELDENIALVQFIGPDGARVQKEIPLSELRRGSREGQALQKVEHALDPETALTRADARLESANKALERSEKSLEKAKLAPHSAKSGEAITRADKRVAKATAAVERAEKAKKVLNNLLAHQSAGLEARAEPAMGRLVAYLKGQTTQLRGLEVAAGARASSSALRDGLIHYMERTLSPEAAQFLAENREGRDFMAKLVKDLSTKGPSQIARQDNLFDEFTAAIDEFFQKERGLKGPWFEANPAVSLAARKVESEMVITNASTAQGIAREFAKHPSELGPLGGVPVEEFLQKAPVHRLAQEGIDLGGTEAATRAALAQTDLGGKLIPTEIAEEAYEAFKRMTAPEEITRFFKGWEKITGLIKGSITLPFPAFHVRNLFSDSILSWVSGAFDFRNVGRALRVATGKDQETLALLERSGAISGTHVRQIKQQSLGAGRGADAADVTSTLLGPTAKARGEKFLGKAKEGFKKGFGKFAGFSETFSRAQHFFTRKAQGWTDAEAAADISKVLFDYGKITKAERGISSTILFYTWTRKVIPSIFRNYLENPRKMALLTRATVQPTAQREEIALPSFIRESSAIPADALAAEGEKGFITGIGSPLEELQKFDPTTSTGGLSGAVGQILRKIGTQLNPLLKFPAELATGKDLFLNKDIVDLNKVPTAGRVIPGLREIIGAQEQELPGGGVRHVGDPFKLHALRQAPWSRALKTLGQLIDIGGEAIGKDPDPRKSWGQQLAIVLTGLRAASLDEVDLARAEEGQLRDEALGMIRQGKVGRFDTFFATDKDRTQFKTGLSKLEQQLMGALEESEGEVFLKQLRASSERRRTLFGEAEAQKQAR